jgi:hypothetical protein
MVSIKDVADVIKMLGDVVKSTREIINAVNDGRKFLALQYPDAQQDFSNLIAQMQQAIEGLAEVTKIISNFRFATDGATVDWPTANAEMVRFNNYIIEQQTNIAKLKNNVRKLKADCDKVRQLRDDLDKRTESKSSGSLFGLLGGKAQKRTIELHGSISNFYADDQRMIELLNQTLNLTDNAIKDVEDAIGPPGMANPYNVPAAAQMLGTYSLLFREPNRELNRLADVMSEARTALTAIKTK